MEEPWRNSKASKNWAGMYVKSSSQRSVMNVYMYLGVEKVLVTPFIRSKVGGVLVECVCHHHLNF
jgi:hypothetical protein